LLTDSIGIDIMIVYGENGKILWNSGSENFLYKYLLYDKKVSPNSFMGKYFELWNEAKIFCKEQVWAVDWFKYVSKNDI